MTDQTAPNSARDTMARLRSLRTAAGRALTLAMAAPLLSGLLLVGQAALLAMILGEAVQGGVPLQDLVLPIALAAAIVIARALIGVCGEHFGQKGAEAIKFDLRDALFAHILARRDSLTLKPASGAVSAAVIDQVEALENFFARYMPAMISATILPIAFAAIVLPVDWIAGLLFLVTAPLIPLFMALAGWGAQAATDRQAAALTRLSAHFADRLRGLLTLKLFGRQQAATAEVHKASEELRRRTNAVLRIAFLSSAILEFFAALSVACVALYVGLTFLGLLPFHPELTLVAGLFILIMAPEIYQPLRQLAAHYHDRATAKSAIEEIERQIADIDKLQTLPATPDARPARKPLALSISGLTVRTDTGRAVLDDLALELQPGTSLAIMGPSGIGKSTLARAIAGLITAEGSITLDGIALADIPEAELRRSLTFIAQKPRLFHGTIAENVALGDPQASRARIRDAAWRIRLTDVTDALPDGLETVIGDGGEGLSGGQAQRVALARLFLTDPGLVILDEPTAQLDGATEDKVLDGVFEFLEGRTAIVLTHSPAVAARADKVMRLAGGRLLPTLPSRRRAAPALSKTGDGQ